jgi:hypothetical protein
VEHAEFPTIENGGERLRFRGGNGLGTADDLAAVGIPDSPDERAVGLRNEGRMGEQQAVGREGDGGRRRHEFRQRPDVADRLEGLRVAEQRDSGALDDHLLAGRIENEAACFRFRSRKKNALDGEGFQIPAQRGVEVAGERNPESGGFGEIDAIDRKRVADDCLRLMPAGVREDFARHRGGFGGRLIRLKRGNQQHKRFIGGMRGEAGLRQFHPRGGE